VAFLDAPEADHVVLEMARRPESELEVLREVKAELGQGIGVIDVKDTEVETPDRVARRIERTACCLGRERIGLPVAAGEKTTLTDRPRSLTSHLRRYRAQRRSHQTAGPADGSQAAMRPPQAGRRLLNIHKRTLVLNTLSY